MEHRRPRFLRCPWLWAVLVLLAAPVRADWNVLIASGPAPIRGVARRADGRLIGARPTGRGIQLLISETNGARWRLHSHVATDSPGAFGDPMVLAVPGTDTVFCAAREHAAERWTVKVYRSNDGGDTWTFDSTVAGPSQRFVGAPFLFLRRNGDLHCYFDSEPLAADNGQPGHQWIAMRGREGIAGSWDHYGLVTVSRENDPGTLSRDGMPTVVQLEGDHLMCVTEGVGTREHGHANVVRTVHSRDGGRTWDFPGRSIAYQARLDPATNRQYNAYAPHAIRLQNGEVWIAFCTDEDYSGPPDLSHQPPHIRHSRIKLVQSAPPYTEWSGPFAVWSRGFESYSAGLFERSANDILSTTDVFGGRHAIQTSARRSPFADILLGLARHPRHLPIGEAASYFREIGGLY